MGRQRLVATALADALLSGASEVQGFVQRAAWSLGRKHRWIAPLCRQVFQHFGMALAHTDRRRLIEWIQQDEGFLAAWNAARVPRIAHYFLDPPTMSSRLGVLAGFNLPVLATLRDLADWLGLTTSELDWFADVRGMNPSAGPLSHYRYAWVPKAYGARLMEIPKPRLREIQRSILRGILDSVPVHDAAHGFRKGKSCRTYVEPHVGRDVVLHMDLRNFFPGIPAPRIHALFATLGYPEAIARALTALCTNAVGMSVARRGMTSWSEAKQLGVPHLPQGAPTSPALANLCALHLDFRVAGLARALEAQYTRYADDIAISGGERLRRRASGVVTHLCAIATSEGFAVNHRKTRSMHRSHRQVLTGIVVNEKPNVRRAYFDRLKAILTNCVRHGAVSQNREGRTDFRAHLAGRIAHVRSLNPARAAKLEAIYREIDWDAARQLQPEPTS